MLLLLLVAAPLSRAASPVVLTTSGWVAGRQELRSAELNCSVYWQAGDCGGPPYQHDCPLDLLDRPAVRSSSGWGAQVPASPAGPGLAGGPGSGRGRGRRLSSGTPGYRVSHTAWVSAGEGQHHAEWRPGERRPARGEQRGLSLPQCVRAGWTAAARSPPRSLLDTRRRLHCRLGPRPGRLQRCVGKPVSVFRCTGRCSTSRTTWWW